MCSLYPVQHTRVQPNHCLVLKCQLHPTIKLEKMHNFVIFNVTYMLGECTRCIPSQTYRSCHLSGLLLHNCSGQSRSVLSNCLRTLSWSTGLIPG